VRDWQRRPVWLFCGFWAAGVALFVYDYGIAAFPARSASVPPAR
jgi:hypothetical protein